MALELNKKAVGEAGAKFILIGEHFVVHGGVTALSFPVKTMKTRVVVEYSSDAKNILCQCTVLDSKEIEQPLPLVARAMEKAIPVALGEFGLGHMHDGFRISSRSNFPVSRGFGSSASFATAAARALAELVSGTKYFDAAESIDTKILKTVNVLERHFHGNPSGIDAATILADSSIKFTAGKVIGTLSNKAADFVLVDGGEREGCKELVDAVSKIREADPKRWELLTATVNAASIAAESALSSADEKGLALAIDQAHDVLRTLSLSTPGIDQIISQALRLGALSGKVSGAGAGGATVLQARPGDGPRLARALKDLGIVVLGWESAHDA